MRTAVLTIFPKFSGAFEGTLYHMYLDVRGLVTTGIGLLLPKSLALTFTWYHANGAIATQAEVAAGWDKIDSLQAYKKWGGNSAVFRNACDLRLDEAGMMQAFASHLKNDETHLRHYFPNYDNVCADAQLALHSMAWADGSAFSPHYPKFTKTFLANDFLGCVDNCWICHKYVRTLGADGKPLLDAHGKVLTHIDEDAIPEDTVPDPDNPGVHPRNLADVLLFRNAAHVVAAGLDPDVLYWPMRAQEAPLPAPPPDVGTSERFPILPPPDLPAGGGTSE